MKNGIVVAIVAAVVAAVTTFFTPVEKMPGDDEPLFEIGPQAAQAGAMVYAIYCEPSEDDEVSSGCAPYRDPFPRPGKDQPSLPDWFPGLVW